MTNIQAVQCIKCGKLHKEKSEEYFKIEGALYIGFDGGLFGPNSTITICLDCFLDYLKEIKYQVSNNRPIAALTQSAE